MNNEKLESIGRKLNLSEKDITNIKKARRKSKFLYPIVGGIIAMLSTVAGYLIGKNAEPKLVNIYTGKVLRGYPYFTPLFVYGSCIGSALVGGSILGFSILKSKSKNERLILITILITMLVSIIGFICAYDFARPIEYYGQPPLYGVFSRRR